MQDFTAFYEQTRSVKQKTDKHTRHSKSFFLSPKRHLKELFKKEICHVKWCITDCLLTFWLRKTFIDSSIGWSHSSPYQPAHGASADAAIPWIISPVILLCFASSYLKLEDFFLRLFRLLNGSCSQSASNIWKFIEKTLEKLWCLFNQPWEILSRNANDVFRMLFQVYIFHVSLTAVTSSLKRSFCTEPGITAELFPLF